MSPLYKYLNKILVKNGKLANSASCCCDCETLLSRTPAYPHTAAFSEPDCNPDDAIFNPPPVDPNPDFTEAAKQIAEQLKLDNWDAKALWGCTCPTLDFLPNPEQVEIDCPNPENNAIAIVTVKDEHCGEDEEGKRVPECCKFKMTLCSFYASAKCCGTLTENNIEYFSEPYSGDFPNGFVDNEWNFEVIQQVIDGETIFLLKATLPECVV